MSVGNHAHHRLVSQYREMRVIRWRVKDGVVDYFYSAFSLIHRNSREEAGNLFCQSELIFYIKHNGIGAFFAVNVATEIKKAKTHSVNRTPSSRQRKKWKHSAAALWQPRILVSSNSCQLESAVLFMLLITKILDFKVNKTA